MSSKLSTHIIRSRLFKFAPLFIVLVVIIFLHIPLNLSSEIWHRWPGPFPMTNFTDTWQKHTGKFNPVVLELCLSNIWQYSKILFSNETMNIHMIYNFTLRYSGIFTRGLIIFDIIVSLLRSKQMFPSCYCLARWGLIKGLPFSR